MNAGLSIRVRRLATPRQTLVEGLAINVAPGTVHALMGPSGCGKSSLLAAVCGTLDPDLEFLGEVLLDGEHLDDQPTQRRRVGILFQDDLLFPHMSVLENLLFALPRGPRGPREMLARQALADVELGSSADANPSNLSGGQRSRVALARALLAQPRALLLDEPFSRLDANLRQRMRTLVFGLVAQRGIPALLVTHDPADVADLEACTHWPTA